MMQRLLLGIASLFALLLSSATPAGAAVDEDPTLGGFPDWSCNVAATDGGTSWHPWFRVTADLGDGTYAVEYAMVPDRRSLFAMPIGTGVVEAASYEEWFDGDLVVSADDTEIPEDERSACNYPYPAPATIRSEVRFLTPPVKPTFTQIRVFCRDGADDPAIDRNDEYTVTSCTQVLIGMVRPEVK